MIATSSHSRSTSSSWWQEKTTGHARVRALAQHAAHDVDADRVEAGERLVEHEHLRVVDERDAELDALLVAERERLDAVAGALVSPSRSIQRSAAAVGGRAAASPCRRAK